MIPYSIGDFLIIWRQIKIEPLGSTLSRTNFRGQPNFGFSSNALKIEGIAIGRNFALNPILVSAIAPKVGGNAGTPFLGCPHF
jgi:hypothetical protein